MNTELTIIDDKFYINGALVYSEIPGCPGKNHGLLMNARFGWEYLWKSWPPKNRKP